MKLWQIFAAMRSVADRDKAQWQSTRFLMYGIACMFSDKDNKPSLHDILPLPWDEKETETEEEPQPIDEAKLKELLESCRQHNAQLQQP